MSKKLESRKIIPIFVNINVHLCARAASFLIYADQVISFVGIFG